MKALQQHGYYNYYTQNFKNIFCWLASRCVYLDSNNCNFSVRLLQHGNVDGTNLFNVYSYGNADGNGSRSHVVPVVTLKSTVHMQKVNDVWQLSL